MAVDLDVQRDSSAPGVPSDEDFYGWVAAATGDEAVSLSIRLVDAEESRRLNAEYRGKDRPTNVLSFPLELPGRVLAELPSRPIGDLAICAPLVLSEAAEQGKPPEHHWAHLTIHGVLHLLGHDHEEEAEASRMEALEVRLLRGLGIPDPYRLES
jgi:probable rRNA maturation factor